MSKICFKITSTKLKDTLYYFRSGYYFCSVLISQSWKTARINDSWVVQRLKTAVQCTLHGDYFEPCTVTRKFYKRRNKNKINSLGTGAQLLLIFFREVIKRIAFYHIFLITDDTKNIVTTLLINIILLVRSFERSISLWMIKNI